MTPGEHPDQAHPPPDRAQLPGGGELELEPVAREICSRYYGEYDDEDGRYGQRGRAWCVHDNRHIVHWAALDLSKYTDLDAQLEWLGRLLHARDFPMDRFVRNLELASAVVGEQGGDAGVVSERLARAAREFEPPA